MLSSGINTPTPTRLQSYASLLVFPQLRVSICTIAPTFRISISELQGWFTDCNTICVKRINYLCHY